MHHIVVHYGLYLLLLHKLEMHVFSLVYSYFLDIIISCMIIGNDVTLVDYFSCGCYLSRVVVEGELVITVSSGKERTH